MKRYVIYSITIILLIVILIALCLLYMGKNPFTDNAQTTEETVIEATNMEVNYDTEDEDTNGEYGNITYIDLQTNTIKIEGNGVVVKETTATIQQAGTYKITGNLADGNIIIEATNNDTVHLILSNVSINCSNNPPIYIKQADKTVITLEEGSTNYLEDGKNYTLETGTDEPNSTIFSKDDLTINGTGTLNISANYNNAITSKDGLKIMNGTIVINAVNHAIKGKDYVVIKNGNFTIKAEGDAIKSSEDTDTEKGYILIEDGIFNLEAIQDGIQAETGIVIKNGEFQIKTGGGSNNNSKNNQNWGMWGKANTSTNEETTSAKGIKARNDITIENANITIDSSDDSIHSNGIILIKDGEYTLTSGDDGIHADNKITIQGGNIKIERSYEGIEASNIEINNGEIHITASDDGINVAGGSDNSSLNGRPGQNSFSVNTNNKMTINNGYIVVDAQGDGLDSNGAIYVNGGRIIVNGPTSGGNGALDYDSTFDMTGGTLIAVGSVGMMQSISSTSTQYSATIVFNNTQQAGTIVNISDESGNEILTVAPSKNFQSIVVCTEKLQKGKKYIVCTGGNYNNGEEKDGIYTNGIYTGGTQMYTFTVEQIVTSVGNPNVNNMMQNGMKQNKEKQGKIM